MEGMAKIKIKGKSANEMQDVGNFLQLFVDSTDSGEVATFYNKVKNNRGLIAKVPGYLKMAMKFV